MVTAPDYEQYGAPTAQVSAQNPTLIPNTDPLLVFDQGSSQFVSPQQYLQLYPRQNASATVTFTGSVTVGDSCMIDLVNGTLPNGHLLLSVLAVTGDTLTSLAEKFLDAANSNLMLQTLGVTAELTIVSSNPVLTFLWPGPVGNLTLLEAKSFVFTATATVAGTVTTSDITNVTFASANLPLQSGAITFAGTGTANNVVNVAFTNPALPNGAVTKSYTVQGGDTVTAIAAALVTAINADANLTAIGISSSSNLGVLSYVWNANFGNVTVGVTFTVPVTDTMALAYVTPSSPSALAPSPAAAQTVTIGGSPTTGEVLHLTIRAQGMSTARVSYTVQSGDTTPTLVATGLAAALNANPNLIAGNWLAVAVGPVITLTWANTMGVPGFVASVTAAATETYTLAQPCTSLVCAYVSAGGDSTTNVATGLKNAVNANVVAAAAGIVATSSSAVVTLHWNSNLDPLTITGGSNGTETVTIANTSGKQTVTIGGSVTVGDQVSVKFADFDALGNPVIVTYTTVTSDTTTLIATGLKNKINANLALANAGVTATSSGAVVTIVTAGASYIPTVTTWVNGQWTVTLASTVTTGDYINVAVTNATLAGGVHNVQYQVKSTDTSLTILAASVAAAITADASFVALDIAATSNAAVVHITAPAALGVLTVASNTNGIETATMSGATPTAAELPVITITDSGLPGGFQTITYTVQMSDTNTLIAAGFKALINANAGCIASGITAQNTGAVLSITSASKNQTTYARTNSANTSIALAGGPGETATSAGSATETSTEADTSTGSETLTVTTPVGGSGPIIPLTNFQFSQGSKEGYSSSMMDFWVGKPYLVDFLTLTHLVTQGMPIK